MAQADELSDAVTFQELLDQETQRFDRQFFIDMPPIYDDRILEDNDMPAQDDPMYYQPIRGETLPAWLQQVVVNTEILPTMVRYHLRLIRNGGPTTERVFTNSMSVAHYLTDIFHRQIDPEVNAATPPERRPGFTPLGTLTPPFTPPPEANPLPQYYADMRADDRALRDQAATMRQMQNELNAQQAARLRERAERWAEQWRTGNPILHQRPAENLEPAFPQQQYDDLQARLLREVVGNVDPVARPATEAEMGVDMVVTPVAPHHHRLGGVGVSGQVGG